MTFLSRGFLTSTLTGSDPEEVAVSSWPPSEHNVLFFPLHLLHGAAKFSNFSVQFRLLLSDASTFSLTTGYDFSGALFGSSFSLQIGFKRLQRVFIVVLITLVLSGVQLLTFLIQVFELEEISMS